MDAASPPPAAGDAPRVLVGCGILRKEVETLIEKNGWRVETHFLASALHAYLGRLHGELDGALAAEAARGREAVVFYGCCHPLMDKLLRKHRAHRTEGQNCVAMLLGYERFMAELEAGAFFLLEDWALGWEPMITAAFGKNPAVVREIFQGSHRHILALRTPCSGDFTAAALAAARRVGLPLRWEDVGLGHLEAVLAAALAERGPA